MISTDRRPDCRRRARQTRTAMTRHDWQGRLDIAGRLHFSTYAPYFGHELQLFKGHRHFSSAKFISRRHARMTTSAICRPARIRSKRQKYGRDAQLVHERSRLGRRRPRLGRRQIQRYFRFHAYTRCQYDHRGFFDRKPMPQKALSRSFSDEFLERYFAVIRFAPLVPTSRL